MQDSISPPTANSGDGPLIPTTDSLPDAVDTQLCVTVGLLALGVLLVMFAGGLGTLLVTEYRPGMTTWNPEKANTAALAVRCLGFMAFAAGLVERVLLHFRDAASRDKI